MHFYAKAPKVVSLLFKERSKYSSSNNPSPTDTPSSQINPFANVGEVENITSLIGWDTPDVKALTYMENDSIEVRLRKISSWNLIPPPYQTVDVHPLDAMKVRGWLINNLPPVSTTIADDRKSDFAHRSPAEQIAKADAIYQALVTGGRAHIDEVYQKLKSMFRGSRNFTTHLWKFLQSEVVSYKTTLPTPLPPAYDHTTQKLHNSTVMWQQSQPQHFSTLPPPAQLPITKAPSPKDLGLHRLENHEGENLVFEVETNIPALRVGQSQTTEERNSIHQKDLELCLSIRDTHNIQLPNDYEDFDVSVHKLRKYKEEQSKKRKTWDEAMSEQRDYKRRRKSYRAKNVRVTQRTPTQVQRDIIEAYMDDVALLHEIEDNQLKQT